MTQVVNAYLAWDFPRVDVDVIQTRGNPGDHVAAARGLLRGLLAVRRISKSDDRAVIVVHLSERGSFVREGLIARYAASRGLPVVAHLHGSEFAAFERAHTSLVGKVLRASTRIISLSDETSAICARHVPPARISLIPNAIPSAAPSVKEPLVVFGGVVSHRKGIDVLQAAWAESSPPPPWRLVVAGPIRDEHLVDRSIPGIEFVGSLAHSELMDLLDSASVAVLPSRDEAMPMFILEAMARRAAVVSTTVGGIPDVLAGDAGVLTAPGDAAALATALRTLTASEPDRARIAASGHARFEERFAASAVFPRIEAIWLDALDSLDDRYDRTAGSTRADEHRQQEIHTA